MVSPPLTFSAEQAVAVQRALRHRLGLADERFPLPAFIGMISDEIEQMRAVGHDDSAICAVIEESTGQRLMPEDLARHYASPEARHRP